MKTLSADAEVVSEIPAHKPSLSTIPSIINIPPQISTTLVWVAVGFALGVWIMWPKNQRS